MSKVSEWLWHTAKRACELKTDFACVVLPSGEARRGPDALVLLDGDARGATLYTLRPPSDAVLNRACEAGVTVAYHVLRHCDTQRLLDAGFDVTAESSEQHATTTVEVRTYPVLRQSVLRTYLKIDSVGVPHTESKKHWLRLAGKKALATKSNYVYIVRGGDKVISNGTDLREALKADVSGSTLYTFRELTARELGWADEAGISRVVVGLSRKDVERIGLWPGNGVRQEIERHMRSELLPNVVEKWNG